MTAAAGTSPDRIEFGMGCFAFEKGEEVILSRDEKAAWATAVESALAAIPSVSEVYIETGADYHGSWSFGPKERPGQPRFQMFRPMPIGAKVRFTIGIPKRFHAGLLRGETLACEKYSVDTYYEYHGPCTFVTCLEGEADGTAGVVLVREFLQRELPRHQSDVTLSTLGPSPFHARVAVERRSAESDLAGVERLPSRGYADYRIWMPYAGEEDLREVARDIQLGLADELSIFYGLVRYVNYGLDLDFYLNSKAESLMEDSLRKGLKGWLRRVFFLGSRTRELGLEEISHRLVMQSTVLEASEVVQAVADRAEDSLLLSALEAQVKALSNLPLNQVSEIVEAIEGSRAHDMEVAVISASTLLGGFAGGVVAALVAN